MFAAAVLSSLAPPPPAFALQNSALATVGPGRVARTVNRGGYQLQLLVSPNKAAAPDSFALRITKGGKPVRGANVTLTFNHLRDADAPAGIPAHRDPAGRLLALRPGARDGRPLGAELPDHSEKRAAVYGADRRPGRRMTYDSGHMEVNMTAIPGRASRPRWSGAGRRRVGHRRLRRRLVERGQRARDRRRQDVLARRLPARWHDRARASDDGVVLVQQPNGKTLTTYKTGSGPHTGVHLIIVRDDLAYIIHDHPPVGADGQLRQTVTFPAPGPYRVLVDAYPNIPGGQPNFQLFKTVDVKGAYHPKRLPPFTANQVVDGYHFDMQGHPPFHAIQAQFVHVNVTDRNGKSQLCAVVRRARARDLLPPRLLDYFHTHICAPNAPNCGTLAGVPASRVTAPRRARAS